MCKTQCTTDIMRKKYRGDFVRGDAVFYVN